MLPLIWTLKQAKRVVVTIIGVTIIGIGIAMIVLPGPAIIVIPIGLGILATEFVWARNLLLKIKDRLPKRMQTAKLNSFTLWLHPAPGEVEIGKTNNKGNR